VAILERDVLRADLLTGMSVLTSAAAAGRWLTGQARIVGDSPGTPTPGIRGHPAAAGRDHERTRQVHRGRDLEARGGAYLTRTRTGRRTRYSVHRGPCSGHTATGRTSGSGPLLEPARPANGITNKQSPG